MENRTDQPAQGTRKQIRKRAPSHRKTPKYCKHSSGKGMVYRGKKPIYFPGLHNSPESLEAYRNYLHKLRGEVPPPPPPETMTMLAFLVKFSKKKLLSLPESEQGHYRVMISVVSSVFYDDLAQEFGPLKLKKAREIFSQEKVRNADRLWSRSQVNKQTRRLVKIFKWGVTEELIPAAQWHALEAVEPLRKGESDAPEKKPIRPVKWADVKRTMAATSPTVAAMIRLHWLTGMRSSNLCELRACDIDMSKEVWEYIPAEHKNAWKEQHLFIAIGPTAQALLFQFIHSREKHEYLFSPRDTRIWVGISRLTAGSRKSSRQLTASARRMRMNPKFRDKYDSHAYRNAVLHAIKKANKLAEKNGTPLVESWHPHQLRHSRGTEIRKRHGAEAAQVSLGHAMLSATEIYAERDMELARKVAKDMG